MKDRIDTLMMKAQSGDAKAQHDLAECFRDGHLVEQSKEQAMYWAFKAVSSGKYTEDFYHSVLDMIE